MPDTPVGTNSPDYTLVSGDLGATIYCKVTATNASGTANADSNTVGPVAAAPVAGSTWNPADLSETTNTQLELTGGNFTAQAVTVPVTDSAICGVRGTLSQSSDKWYFEVTLNTIPSNDGAFGLASATAPLNAGVPGATNTEGFCQRMWVGIGPIGGIVYNNGAASYDFTLLTPTPVEGSVWGFAIDMTTRAAWFRFNGTWCEGDPVAGTGGLAWGATPTTLYPIFVCQPTVAGDGSVTLNTGGSAFAHTIPSGFTAWG